MMRVVVVVVLLLAAMIEYTKGKVGNNMQYNLTINQNLYGGSLTLVLLESNEPTVYIELPFFEVLGGGGVKMESLLRITWKLSTLVKTFFNYLFLVYNIILVV